MAKATITITDTPDKRFMFSVEFDPPLPDREEDATAAQLFAVGIYDDTVTRAHAEGRQVTLVESDGVVA